MTVEELLYPRIKCIASFPGIKREGWEVDLIASENLTIEDIMLPIKYPYLFVKVEWWEERNIKDMPEYIKDDNKVYKVLRWKSNRQAVIIDGLLDNPEYQFGISMGFNEHLPATEEEYSFFNVSS